jgi:hypothetical protein
MSAILIPWDESSDSARPSPLFALDSKSILCNNAQICGVSLVTFMLKPVYRPKLRASSNHRVQMIGTMGIERQA